MKRILKSAIILIATVTFIFGLQSCNSVKPIDKTQLEGYWVLKSLKGEDAKAAFEGSIPSIEFDFSQNMVFGSGGCNRYTGSFNLTEQNMFTATNSASTMMMCVDPNKEPLFLSTIATPELLLSLSKDGVLTFTKDKEVVLEFVKGEAPSTKAMAEAINAESLAGLWTLTSIAGGDMSSLFADRKPTMEFSADNKIFGNAGCNTYNTAYTLEENTITFGPVASTKMACPNLKGENMFTNLLATPLQAELNGDKLTLLKSGEVVLEFVKTQK